MATFVPRVLVKDPIVKYRVWMLLLERDVALRKEIFTTSLIWTGYLLPFCKQLPVQHKYERSSMDGIEYETFQAGNTYTKGSKSSLTINPAVETSVCCGLGGGGLIWFWLRWFFDTLVCVAATIVVADRLVGTPKRGMILPLTKRWSWWGAPSDVTRRGDGV